MIYHSAEFWSSVAFVIVVAVALRPVGRYLNRWTKRQDAQITAELEQAKNLRAQAEELKDEYQKAFQNRWKERAKLMREADREIEDLRAETESKTHDRILHKRQEVALRLKVIEENGRQEVKNQMLSKVVRCAGERLRAQSEAPASAVETDQMVAQALAAVDAMAPILKK